MSITPSIQAHKLPDTKQNSWHLSAIQLVGVTSLPVLATSILILQNHTLFNAILTLLIGNILLWVVRLGIMSMSFAGRKSTLDISRDYVGNFGGYIIASLLLLSTLAWFVAQTTIASNALTLLLPINEGPDINLFIQISVALGILSTLLCMEGIVVLRWLSVIALPILILAFLGVLFTAPLPSIDSGPHPFTLSGLPLVLATNLGVTADLPTFFRHSKSWKSSFFSLFVIQVISLALGIGGLFLGAIIEPWFGLQESVAVNITSTTLHASLVILIFLSAISANVANVYSASVGWEIIAPVLAGRKEYLILGLGLTTIFILLANVVSIDFLLNPTDAALVNLCLILLLGYIISRAKNRKPKSYDQSVYFISWLIATLINILQFTHFFLPRFPPLYTAIGTILFITGIGYLLKKFRSN